MGDETACNYSTLLGTFQVCNVVSTIQNADDVAFRGIQLFDLLLEDSAELLAATPCARPHDKDTQESHERES